MTRTLTFGLLLLLLGGAVACDDDCGGDRERCAGGNTRALPPVGPTVVSVPPPTPAVHTFEFRVLGDDLHAVDIRYGTSQEGTTILVSQTPWFVTVRTTQLSSFLTISARGRLDPDDVDPDAVFLHVQILVDGHLFREASAIGLEPSVSVSGLFAATP